MSSVNKGDTHLKSLGERHPLRLGSLRKGSLNCFLPKNIHQRWIFRGYVKTMLDPSGCEVKPVSTVPHGLKKSLYTLVLEV